MPLHIGRGPRLEFVVRKLPGKRKRAIHSWDKQEKKIKETLRDEDAGFMLYFPNGTSYRLTKEEIVSRKFNRPPRIINIEMANDTETPAGKYKHALDEATRKAAYKEMEEQVIRACKRRAGNSEGVSSNDAEAA